MAGDPRAKRLLLPSSQLQSFSFQSNYVFVDEHNRYKRKVMRACEECRRRKIKCDAATTNTWPCSACIRLKLHCVPPTGQDDRDFTPNPQVFEPERREYESRGSGDDDYHPQMSAQQQLVGSYRNIAPIYNQQVPCPDSVQAYQSGPYGEPPSSHSQPNMHYDSAHTSVSVINQHQNYSPQAELPTPLLQHQQPRPESLESYEHGHCGQQNLAFLLGELRIDETGTAPYMNNRFKMNKLEPAFEDFDEYEHVLPPFLSGPDLKVRIPPELMPDEETVLRYFGVYFTNVHPYVPVLNKALFYHQWHTNREAISPLILDAIFAIAGRLADEPDQGRKWLALATKHAESFMDAPRLSTLQALLILLKARESAPKRGYYFRSWMMVVQCVPMAKDLGLDEHYEDHKAGKPCGSDFGTCITKTRIWQTIFLCELMVGSTQGRTNLSVDMESLDLSIPRPADGFDCSEFQITRNFIYFMRVARNVRGMNNVYSRTKKKKDWGIDPNFVQLNHSFDSWMNDLPDDLQITFPADGSPPCLPSHFIGNLHCYHYLSVILIRLPQLTFMEQIGTGIGREWKDHIMLCYSSAKLLCRLQEAILESFGMTGLLCMQRGIDFTIYCVLTCAVLHLTALTSPDPDLNTDSREYFTRHMRILEKCNSSWPMPEVQKQIDALRETFSADIRKPFVLKPSYSYGSPGAPVNTTPPFVNEQYQQASPQGTLQNKYAPQQDQVVWQAQQPQQRMELAFHHHGTSGNFGC